MSRNISRVISDFYISTNPCPVRYDHEIWGLYLIVRPLGKCISGMASRANREYRINLGSVKISIHSSQEWAFGGQISHVPTYLPVHTGHCIDTSNTSLVPRSSERRRASWFQPTRMSKFYLDSE